MAAVAAILAGVVLVSWLLTGAIRRYALRTAMVDIPNERSSHLAPTPRGGGLAIGIMILAAVPILYGRNLIDVSLFLAIVTGGPAVLLIGWLDDRLGLPAAWRGAGYLAAAALAVWLLAGAPAAERGYGSFPAGLPGQVLATLALAWLINLYNFMDGTDALAGVETLSVVAYAAVLFLLAGDAGSAWMGAVLGAACAGFLLWNWPPAAIFMGDAGSCLIGYLLGVLALAGEARGDVPILAWVMLLSVFLCDATLTLLRRIIAGERWYSPHRVHAYQLLVQAGWSHRRLALAVLAVNVLVMGPLALIAVWNRDWLVPAAVAACIAMSLVWGSIQLRLRPQ